MYMLVSFIIMNAFTNQGAEMLESISKISFILFGCLLVLKLKGDNSFL